MQKFTINVNRMESHTWAGGYEAVIEELKDCDSEVFIGSSPAEALGHAMFHLSCVDDLEKGVKLDITNTE